MRFTPTTRSEWETQNDVGLLCKAYKGRKWFPKLQAFAIECCAPLERSFDNDCRETLEIARRFILNAATKQELWAARKLATGAVNSAVTVVGKTTHYNKPIEEALAQAALACTYNTEQSAIHATMYTQEAWFYIKLNELLNSGIPESKASSESNQYRLMINDEQVALLKEMVGNPFAGNK